jgi:serine/threonine protein kinase
MIKQKFQIIRGSEHIHIVHFYTSFIKDKELWIVTELLGGSVNDIMTLKQHVPPSLVRGFRDETVVATIMFYIVDALNYLHETNFLHRNIKGKCIFLSDDGVVKLGDGGTAASMYRYDDLKTTLTGNYSWLAPEVIDSSMGGYGKPADVWSLGITMIELLVGKPIGADSNPDTIPKHILLREPPSIKELEKEFSNLSKEFKNLLKQIFKLDPSKRLTTEQILEHKFFINNKKDESYLMENVMNDLPPIDERFEKILEYKKRDILNILDPKDLVYDKTSRVDSKRNTPKPKPKKMLEDWSFSDEDNDIKTPNSTTKKRESKKSLYTSDDDILKKKDKHKDKTNSTNSSKHSEEDDKKKKKF